MPKSQFVDPKKVFEPGYIHFHDIPVCQYNLTLDDEKKIYSKSDFVRIYRDMAVIREFETMLKRYQNEKRLQRRRIFQSRSRTPFHRTGGLRRRRGVLP